MMQMTADEKNRLFNLIAAILMAHKGTWDEHIELQKALKTISDYIEELEKNQDKEIIEKTL